jgi:hypothetical protein
MVISTRTSFFWSVLLFYGSDVADLVFVPTLAWRCRPTIGRAAFRTYF